MTEDVVFPGLLCYFLFAFQYQRVRWEEEAFLLSVANSNSSVVATFPQCNDRTFSLMT